MKALRSFLCEWDATQENERVKAELTKKPEAGVVVTTRAMPPLSALQGGLERCESGPVTSGLGARTKLEVESATRRALQLITGLEAKEERRKDMLQVRAKLRALAGIT